MPAGGLVVTGAIGLGTAIYGAIQKNKAAKLANKNVEPTYTIPQYEADNLSLAESRAGQGMSDASRQQLLNNSNSGLAATEGAILRSGGSANAISGAQDKYQQGLNQMSIYDDQARLGNLANLQSAYTRASAESDKAWQINQYAPWANRAQAIAQQSAAADKTMWAGINSFGKSAGALAGSGSLGGGIPETRDKSDDVDVPKLPTYGAYGSANTSFTDHAAPLWIPDTDIKQQQVPQIDWNGFYPSQQP